jgi:hypothetical protein
VQLSNPSVWRLLRSRLGWSMQRPERQAKERDEKAIQHSVAHEWPRIKRARAESAWIVFFDDSGISLTPPVRRTWSPRGTTPILRHRVARKRASMAAAPGYHPGGTRASGVAWRVGADTAGSLAEPQLPRPARAPLEWAGHRLESSAVSG